LSPGLGQGKLTRLRCENQKIQHENERLHAKGVGTSECISGIADFQVISELAISGLENLEISGLAFSVFKQKN
jgi:hypothetical protein